APTPWTGSATSIDGHTNNVVAVGFEQEGKWMFTGSEDSTIKVGGLIALRAHTTSAKTPPLVCRSGMTELISGDRDGNIRIWDLTQNKRMTNLVPDGAKAIRSVSISNDATKLAAANDVGSVFVWSLERGQEATKLEPLQKLQVKRLAKSCLLSRPVELLCSHLFPLLSAHSTYIIKCVISPDCKRLATTSADTTVKIWDIENNFA
ncbi:MAG: hypothetical protein SGPRY_013515, partial [Prymnesium sp.]